MVFQWLLSQLLWTQKHLATGPVRQTCCDGGLIVGLLNARCQRIFAAMLSVLRTHSKGTKHQYRSITLSIRRISECGNRGQALIGRRAFGERHLVDSTSIFKSQNTMIASSFRYGIRYNIRQTVHPGAITRRNMATVGPSIPHEFRTASEPREEGLQAVIIANIKEVNDNVSNLERGVYGC